MGISLLISEINELLKEDKLNIKPIDTYDYFSLLSNEQLIAAIEICEKNDNLSFIANICNYILLEDRQIYNFEKKEEIDVGLVGNFIDCYQKLQLKKIIVN